MANIEPQVCSTVYGVAYRITLQQLFQLDVREGVAKKQYDRVMKVQDWTNGQETMAEVYVGEPPGPYRKACSVDNLRIRLLVVGPS